MKNQIENVLWIIGLIILAGLLFALPLMILWNLLMPSIFGLPLIDFWQAFGLQLISNLLFGKKQTNKWLNPEEPLDSQGENDEDNYININKNKQ